MGDKKGSVLMQRYEQGKILGHGTFAKVYQARNIETGANVAIKVVDKEKVLKVGMIEQIKREISVMRLVRHPHVVQLYEVMASKAKIYIVMEHVRGGELFDKVARGKIKGDIARKYFQQLISAVDYCHSRGVYHRDLKPENLLLDQNEDLKITDFGLSALAESRRQDGLLHTMCGTPAYVAPEVIHRKGYDGAKADIWSCGVVLFVLLAGYLPFQDSNLIEMYKKIGKAEFKFPNMFPSDVKRLLLKIMDPNPKTRISIAKIMENSWFRKGFDSKLLENRHESDAYKTGSVQDDDSMFGPCYNLNAFDIISFSEGFDLSGLFEDKSQKKEVRFSARETALTIISKLEDISKKLKLKVKKKNGGIMRFEGCKEGRKGILCFDAEIFEVTPTFHMIELKKLGGDTLEYLKVVRQEMRPALKDIIWTWQGEQET
ncbi:CBL-interacting protein kinase 2-like [Silene latifolia]|uniref:CBL-interacting protein kinase 2-like n=1 Tax=Silene latifolia TaxID=37657 RepID=UPI003D7807CC